MTLNYLHRILKYFSRLVLESCMKRLQAMANLSKTSKLVSTSKTDLPIMKAKVFSHTTMRLLTMPIWQESSLFTYWSIKRLSIWETRTIAKTKKAVSLQSKRMKNLQRNLKNHRMSRIIQLWLRVLSQPLTGTKCVRWIKMNRPLIKWSISLLKRVSLKIFQFQPSQVCSKNSVTTTYKRIPKILFISSFTLLTRMLCLARA